MYRFLSHGIVVLLALIAIEAQGRVLESRTMKSNILGKDLLYSVYLPPDFDSSGRSYPVLYLLHGYSDDQTSWVHVGEINQIMDKAIADGTMPPVVVIMPDGDISWYSNVDQLHYNWENMFFKEMMPYMEKEYRAGGRKDRRIIAGLSMGGFGALKYAMKHTDKFAMCMALSPAVFTDEDIVNMGDNWFGERFEMMFLHEKGEARINERWRSENPIHLAKSVPADRLKSVRFYIDCGDRDFLYRGNAALHVAMRDAGIPHECRMRQGDHNWVYWREGLRQSFPMMSGVLVR